MQRQTQQAWLHSLLPTPPSPPHGSLWPIWVSQPTFSGPKRPSHYLGRSFEMAWSGFIHSILIAYEFLPCTSEKCSRMNVYKERRGPPGSQLLQSLLLLVNFTAAGMQFCPNCPEPNSTTQQFCAHWQKNEIFIGYYSVSRTCRDCLMGICGHWLLEIETIQGEGLTIFKAYLKLLEGRVSLKDHGLQSFLRAPMHQTYAQQMLCLQHVCIFPFPP